MFSSGPLSSKYKTAIHNCLAQLLCNNDYNFSKTKQEIIPYSNNYCVCYAIAMLSFGAEKQEYLAKCILSKQNDIGLGICALWDDMKNAKKFDCSIMEDLITKLRTPAILLGNRYWGKSVQMIADSAKLKPLCFADDERHGRTFNGTMTYSIKEALKQFKTSMLLMCVTGKQEQDINESLAQNLNINKVTGLYPLTLKEMHMSEHLSGSLLSSIDKFKNEYNLESLMDYLSKALT